MTGHLTRLETLIEYTEQLSSIGERRILGITGAPGAGKSTLAEKIVAALGAERAVLVPADGFHLSNRVLLAMGLRQLKGSLKTFDDIGFAELLRRIVNQKKEPYAGELIYAPDFKRELEEPIAGSITIRPEVPLVITEGNYLLTGHRGWADAARLLDESWYLDIPDELRLSRLVQRHRDFGKSAEDAWDWAHHSDEDNARLIRSTRQRADRVLQLE